MVLRSESFGLDTFINTARRRYAFKFTPVHVYGRDMASAPLLRRSDEMCLSCPTRTSRQSASFLDVL
jgi:hypothetical protein